ncbi:YqzL family protein [Virgibacillus byunsanensis]|uniref:YqzL family protein n=1 Tax=Virgibacillus byunsanensis TaxID=570945 RepID=A0ABW3LJF0_9BACI
MIDFTWKLFSQTGNIDTYLLLKELETEPNSNESNVEMENQEVSPLDTNL